MKQHIIPGAIAAVVATAIGTGGAYLMRPAPQQKVVTTSGKSNPLAWGELDQREVDALTEQLNLIPAKLKGEVGIFCANRDCDDLALDFDNAFESAHWKSGIERPLADTNVGIHVGPPGERAGALAAAIVKATDGRIVPELLDAQIIGENRLVLVISRKPK